LRNLADQEFFWVQFPPEAFQDLDLVGYLFMWVLEVRSLSFSVCNVLLDQVQDKLLQINHLYVFGGLVDLLWLQIELDKVGANALF
jgi:hypothetical protein